MGLLTLKWMRDWLHYERPDEDLNERICHHYQPILSEPLTKRDTEICEINHKIIFIFTSKFLVRPVIQLWNVNEYI